MTDQAFARRCLARLATAAAGLLLSSGVLAAGGGALERAGTDIGDRAALQRGAQLYMNYCAGCHSLKFMRYSRMAEDLGLTEDEVMDNLNFSGAAYGEHIVSSMPAEQASQWFGQAPPDLSLITRVRGSDWVYTYLKSFYLDETRPLGWNNTLFANASMPNPLWEMQGLQRPVHGPPDVTGEPVVTHLEPGTPGSQDALQFDRTVRDITTFLEYVGEPAALKRQRLGVWVLLFLGLLTFLAWLLKRDYWRDVH